MCKSESVPTCIGKWAGEIHWAKSELAILYVTIDLLPVTKYLLQTLVFAYFSGPMSDR